MTCRDPDILRLRGRLEEGQATAAEAQRLATLMERREATYRREIRALATGMRAWDEATVDAFVHQHTGGRTTSRAETTRHERARMLERLRADGLLRPGSGRRQVRQQAAAKPLEDLAAKVRALLLDAGRDDAYAHAIANKRFRITRWQWLGYRDLEALMQMLIIDQARRAARRVVLAVDEGRPWDAWLSDGERANGVAERAASECIRRGWITLDSDGAPSAITERGREIAAQCAEDTV